MLDRQIIVPEAASRIRIFADKKSGKNAKSCAMRWTSCGLATPWSSPRSIGSAGPCRTPFADQEDALRDGVEAMACWYAHRSTFVEDAESERVAIAEELGETG